jgi:hypothetical protein
MRWEWAGEDTARGGLGCDGNGLGRILLEEEQLDSLALADDGEVVRLGEGGLVTVDLDALHLYVVAAHGWVRCRQHVSEVTPVDESCTEAQSERWCAHPRFCMRMSKRQHVCLCKALTKLKHEPMYLKLRVHMASTACGQLQL